MEGRCWQVVRVYELAGESAWSGSARYRQAVAGMLRDARVGRFEVLAGWSLDRLTQGGPLEALRLLDQLGRAGVQVVTGQEPWLEVGSSSGRARRPGGLGGALGVGATL